MTWLKKIGEFIASGVKEASIFFPFLAPIASLIPGQVGQDAVKVAPIIANDLAAMQNIIVNIEAMYKALGNTSGGGAAKLAAAIPYFNSLLLNSEIVANHKIAQPDLFNKAVSEYAQATVDLLNSFEPPSNPADHV